MAKHCLRTQGLKCHPQMSSIHSFAASVNAYDHLNDVFWGDVINHRVKRPHGMWIHVETFFWREKRIANELEYRILCRFVLIVWLNVELQQLLGCDKKTGLLNPMQGAQGTWWLYTLGKPAWQGFVRKSPVTAPRDKGIRKRIRIIFPGGRFKVCYSYSRLIPKRLPRSVYLKTAAN